MSEKITYKDSKGNVYEQVDCERYEECDGCAFDNNKEACLAVHCHHGANWQRAGEKIPDIDKTLWGAVAACQQMRGSVCACVAFPCRYWIAKTCPSRKHLAALGDENAWRAK